MIALPDAAAMRAALMVCLILQPLEAYVKMVPLEIHAHSMMTSRLPSNALLHVMALIQTLNSISVEPSIEDLQFLQA